MDSNRRIKANAMTAAPISQQMRKSRRRALGSNRSRMILTLSLTGPEVGSKIASQWMQTDEQKANAMTAAPILIQGRKSRLCALGGNRNRLIPTVSLTGPEVGAKIAS